MDGVGNVADEDRFDAIERRRQELQLEQRNAMTQAHARPESQDIQTALETPLQKPREYRPPNPEERTPERGS